MTTCVLVHGGGHGGWCDAKVKRLLEAAGHEVFDEARAKGRLWSIDTGHDLMITEPHVVADALQEVAADPT